MKTKTFFYSILSAMLLSVSMNASAAADNPFTTIQNGFTVIAQTETSEGKCGTAKCGGQQKEATKCGAVQPAQEPSKCGAGK
ncbi:hypothetical protein [Thiomicrorhabdus xiamenensis]|uniref:Low-complexity protein n=1 Tax=Thiomicrorhabdus xiamenensis TaxID=2739063 RepID=A0A7D4SYV1_9GAMM|nr:hypothetical protein [Thiomicrorhabdus xiamenensis]QKI89384.1 hypothetical protein HQN79_07295 [Thiomicrorhabdus xiamenensis]